MKSAGFSQENGGQDHSTFVRCFIVGIITQVCCVTYHCPPFSSVHPPHPFYFLVDFAVASWPLLVVGFFSNAPVCLLPGGNDLVPR
jgi:hypothetical protein